MKTSSLESFPAEKRGAVSQSTAEDSFPLRSTVLGLYLSRDTGEGWEELSRSVAYFLSSPKTLSFAFHRSSFDIFLHWEPPTVAAQVNLTSGFTPGPVLITLNREVPPAGPVEQTEEKCEVVVFPPPIEIYIPDLNFCCFN